MNDLIGPCADSLQAQDIRKLFDLEEKLYLQFIIQTELKNAVRYIPNIYIYGHPEMQFVVKSHSRLDPSMLLLISCEQKLNPTTDY